jgi:hypothetical protein
MSQPIGYLFEPHDFTKLQAICKALFGDGTHMTADQRRDLANLMRITLDHAQPVLENSDKMA